MTPSRPDPAFSRPAPPSEPARDEAPAAADPWALLDAARTVLTVHAHPDDESLSTGALLAHLASQGTRVVLATATRGEKGEIIPGTVSPGDPRDFADIRMTELDGAARALGVAERHLLGTAPALADDAEPRWYRDSGMQWITPTLAGPDESTGPDAFTRRPREQARADLLALIAAVGPDVLVSYDDGGTYGHPDHVLTHELTAEAAAATGIPFCEVASYHDTGEGIAAEGVRWRDLPETGDALAAALGSHRTQLTVLSSDSDGVRLRLSGGQERRVPLRAGVRLHRPQG